MTTLNIMTLSIMTFNIKSLSTMALSTITITFNWQRTVVNNCHQVALAGQECVIKFDKKHNSITTEAKDTIENGIHLNIEACLNKSIKHNIVAFLHRCLDCATLETCDTS